MSKATIKFENDIANAIKKGEQITKIPFWMRELGFTSPEDKVISSTAKGSNGGKTDILIEFQSGNSLKISAKLTNADYYGNWYSHKRINTEFGHECFNKLIKDCTDWANNIWSKSKSASFFIGVSVCFGKRTGDTGRRFTDIFTYDDIIKIVAGIGPQYEKKTANCLLISNNIPRNIQELVNNLEPINEDIIQTLSENFKVIYRPINPMTEGTNRGKCIYTQFTPFKKLESPTIINNLNDLMELGNFQPVIPNSLNHNRLIKELKNYNIIIPTK